MSTKHSPLTICLQELMRDQTQMLKHPWVRNIAIRFLNALSGQRTRAYQANYSIKDLARMLSIRQSKLLGAIMTTERDDDEVIKELIALLQTPDEPANLIIEDFAEGLNASLADRTSLHVYALMLLNWEAVAQMTGPKQLSDFLLQRLPEQLSEGIKGNLCLEHPFRDRVRKMAERAGLRFKRRKAAPRPSRTPLISCPYPAEPTRDKIAA